MIASHSTSRIGRLLLLLTACALIPCAAPEASAGSGKVKAALRQFKKEKKSNLRQFGKELKLIARTLDQQLDVVDYDVNRGNAPVHTAGTVFIALDEFQESVIVRQGQAVQRFSLTLVQLYKALAAEGVQDADLPTDVQFGAGGTSDAFDAGLRALVADATKTAQRRALKTAAKFRKKSGVGLNVLVLPAAAPQSYAVFNNGSSTSMYSSCPLTIEVVVAARLLNGSNTSGLLYVGGSARHGSNPRLTVFGKADTSPVPSLGHRWSTTCVEVTARATNIRLKSAETLAGCHNVRINVP